MVRDRKGLRGVVLSEDRRTERFVRHLLEARGFDKRRFDFRTAPSGRGAGEAWVLLRYPPEVKRLRAQAHQRLCVVALRDGDSIGVDARKVQFDDALRQADLAVRGTAERIATLVPTWAIENWLLDLLGHADIDENREPSAEGGQTWKQLFDRKYLNDEKSALVSAASTWMTTLPRLPSLHDGRGEFARIEQ